MAIVAKSPRSTPITLAAPSAGPFLVGFPLFDLDALEVYIDGVRTEDFTISASFVGGVDIAATVTFGAEVLAGSTIIINGALSPRREADYLPRDPGLTDKLNNEFSRVWSSLQEVKRDTGRSLRAFSDLDAIEPEDGAVLMWDGDQIGNGPTGDEISGAQAAAATAVAAAAEAVEAAAIATAVSTGADFEQVITSGTVSSYTFPFEPATIRNVALTIGGVRQTPIIHYNMTDDVTPGVFDTMVFDAVVATTENPVFIQARFALPGSGANTVMSESGLTVQQEMDRTGRSYFSRAAAVAATIPVGVNRISVLHDGVWLDYVRDTSGTALTSTGGINWSPADVITVRHWGAVGGAVMATSGTVSGADCTAQAQAMIDWILTFSPTGASRGAVPAMEWGLGNFRLSGSLNFTGFSTNARMIKLTGYGATILADCAGQHAFDLTDAQYIELAGFVILGSANSMPLCAVKTGRKGNNDGAAYVTLRDIRTRAGTNVASVRSFFSVAALWQMASETSREENCVWENFHTGAAAYGAAFDNINALSYGPLQTIASMTATNPAVFTITGHGYTTGQIVVASRRSAPTLTNSGSMTVIEGTALTVTVIDANTFRLANDGGDLDGTAFALPSQTALARELITPSTFIGRSRPEPFKRHSQLHNVRHGNTYFNHEGKAAVFQGCCEGVTFDQCFLVGKIGFHMLYTQQRSQNDLHWAQCNFGDHLEGGGTIGTVDDWMLVEPATADAGTVARFNRCVFNDNTMQAFYAVNTAAGTTARFVDCEFSIARNASSFVQFAKTPAEVFILGGTVGMGDLADFNLARENCTATLVDYALETEKTLWTFCPLEYGAKGDGVTDDGVALNATFAALKAYVEGFPGQAGTASVDLKGRAYLTSISVNATNINAGGWGLRDGLIIGTCSGKAVLDLTGSRWATLESVTVYGDPLSAPAIGIQVGRDGLASAGGFCDGHSWRMVQTRGSFTTTAVYVYGQESTHYDHCQFWNENPDGHCGVHTGFDWIPYTSDYSAVATGSVSYIQNKYTNCEWRHIPTGRRFAITGASATNPFVVTVASHNFEIGDDICIGDMEGMVEPFGLVATVTAKTATTLTFGAVDASTWTAWTSGGAVTLADSVSALVVGDGSLHTFERCYTVSNGQAGVEMVFSGVRPARHYFMDMHYEGECHGPCVKFTGGTGDRTLVNCDFRTHNARPAESYFGQTVDAFDTVFQGTEVIVPTKRFPTNTHTLFDDQTRYSMSDATVTVWEAAAVTVGSMAGFSGTLAVAGSARRDMNRIDIQHTGDLSDLRFMDVTGATVEGFIRHATAAQAITINPTGVSGQQYTFGTAVFNSSTSRSLGAAASPWSTVWGTQYRVGNLAASAPIITTNAGTPEGVVTAVPGSICFNTSGGAGTSLYVKETGTGNTGWVGK